VNLDGTDLLFITVTATITRADGVRRRTAQRLVLTLPDEARDAS
jgi:hypothetical protein